MISKLRNSASTLILVAGVLLLLYPIVSNWVNKAHATFISNEYNEAVADMEEEQRQEMLEAARDYNARLFAQNSSLTPSEIVNGNVSNEEYKSLLDPTGIGVMATLTLPKLNVTMPVYHGSTESVLQSGIGHLEYTSLPVGGENTHAALSGHRGLPNKQLFTDLDQIQIGDVFYIEVLGEALAYQVDQIKTVLPSDVSELAIVEGQDYVTLVTCTPYGVNTHRLLVRGTRIPYEAALEAGQSGGFFLTELQKELLTAALILAVFFLIRYLIQRRQKKKQILQEPPSEMNESDSIQNKELDESKTESSDELEDQKHSQE